MTFGEKLKELREKTGLSQAGLAEKSGVPVGTIRDYEQAKRMPLLPTAFKLAAALDTDCRAFAECVDQDAESQSPGRSAKVVKAAPKRSRRKADSKE